jgi:hypothetical protein
VALFAAGLIRPGEPVDTSSGQFSVVSVTTGLARAQPPPVPPPGPPPVPPPEAACGLTDLGGCVSGAVDAFLRGLVSDALNPLLIMLSDTLLTTPTLEQLPGLRQLWEQSWQILLAAYALLVLLAGILIMGHETVQTRHSLREIAPRIVLGFVAGALSLTVAGMAVDTANALSTALLGAGVDPSGGAVGLRNLLTSAITTDTGGAFQLMLGLAVALGLVAVLLTYVVRVFLTVVLIAGAPIALMFHALPQTEGIARWWWRTFAACLAIQIVQSLTLITALNLLLTPGRGFTPFTEPAGTGVSGALPTMLAVLALLFILYRIPFWLLAASRIGHGRTLIASVVRGFIAYRTLGLLRGQPTHRARAGSSGAGSRGPSPGPGGGSGGGGPGGSGGGPGGGGGPRPSSGGPRGPGGSGGSGGAGAGGTGGRRGPRPSGGSGGAGPRPGAGPGHGRRSGGPGGGRSAAGPPAAAAPAPARAAAAGGVARGPRFVGHGAPVPSVGSGSAATRPPMGRLIRPPSAAPPPRPVISGETRPTSSITPPRSTPPSVTGSRVTTTSAHSAPSHPAPTPSTAPRLRGGQYPPATPGASPRPAASAPSLDRARRSAPPVSDARPAGTRGHRPAAASPSAPARPASSTGRGDAAPPETPPAPNPTTAPPASLPQRRRRPASSGDPS